MNQNAQDNAADLRARLKRRRADLPPGDRDRGALLIRGRLYTWLATSRTRLRESGRPDIRRIAAFWSMADEPALQALLGQWAQDDTLTVSLPVVAAPGEPLRFRAWTPDTPMRPGAYGILEPEGPEAPAPDIVLVPTLGYTRQGDRLGYGGGYYDRTLEDLRRRRKVTAIGVGFDLQFIPDVPHGAGDQRLDWLLTDRRACAFV